MTAEGWEPGDLNPQDQWPADFESAASTNSARLPRLDSMDWWSRSSAVVTVDLGSTVREFGLDVVVTPIEVLQA